MKKFYFITFVLVGFYASAQQTTAISGKITGENSKPIGYATVSFLNTNMATITDGAGNYSITGINAGKYAIAVSAIGYATLNDSVLVSAPGNNHADFQLADEAVQLGAVIVSAEKKEDNLQNVPVSISSLISKNVDEFRLWNNKDISGVIPNLYAANPGDGRNVISIRGITSSSYDPAVTTYIDGVNQFTLDTYIPQLFDIERIEVLRGPQGTLYGRNAMGGVINIITKQPTNKTSGYVEINEGNYGTQRYVAGIKTPLIKNKLFFGASFLYEGLNGYYHNKYNNSDFDKQHAIGGNYYLKYLANKNWAITLNAKHVSNRNYGSFSLAGSAKAAFDNPFVLNQNAIAKLVDDIFNSSLSLNYSGAHFNFSSQTSYQYNYRYYTPPIDGDFSPLDIITIVNDYGRKWNNVKIISQEFKFTSPAASASPLKWTAGTYFFYQNTPNKQATHFGKDAGVYGSPNIDYSIINTTKAKSYGAALYAQANYSVNKMIDVVAGVRYDYQYTKENVLGEYQPDASPTPTFQTQPDTSGHASYSAFSPMAGIVFRAAKTTNIFATYTRGYRTGGLTDLGADPSQPPLYAYKPEYSNNFEIGIKNTLFNNKLRANISFFYTTITNAQVPTLVLPAAITITKNAGGLSSKGFDAELTANIIKGLEASYNFGYTHAAYTALNLAEGGSVVDLKGNKQIFTPDVTSMLAAQYSLPVNTSQTIKIVLRGEWFYTGKTYFDLVNTISQSSYHLLNTRVGISIKNYGLYFWGRNLTDVKYISYAYDFGAVHLGNPKTYGITLQAAF